MIVTTHIDLPQATKTALAALVKANNPEHLFLLGDSPVRAELNPDDGRPITRELTEARVLHHLARVIRWVKRSSDGEWRPTPPSAAVARDILASPQLPFPPLERIVAVPVFGRDGSLCAKAGYHRGSRVLYQPSQGFELPPIAPTPTEAQIASARDLLLGELLGDFPFVGDAERAHALALLLLPFARDLIDGPTPLHLIEKPTAGTGGSLLADVLLRPALGRPLPTMTTGNDSDETRKRVTAILGESPTAVVFDNIRRLDLPDLAAVLTSVVWKDRPLGVSRVVQLPVRCAWIATANNPALTFELARRTVRIRLDASSARPWLRGDFRHPDLVEWTMRERGALVAAALTLVQAWIVAGKPAGTHSRLGSYEAWSRVLGGILERVGVPGFLGNLPELYQHGVDDETQAWPALVQAWATRYDDCIVGVREVWALTDGPNGVDLDLGDKGERSQLVRLGKMLGRMRDCVFGTYRVVNAGVAHRANQWRLQPIGTKPRNTSGDPA